MSVTGDATGHLVVDDGTSGVSGREQDHPPVALRLLSHHKAAATRLSAILVIDAPLSMVVETTSLARSGRPARASALSTLNSERLTPCRARSRSSRWLQIDAIRCTRPRTSMGEVSRWGYVLAHS